MGKESKRNAQKNEVLEKVMAFLRKEYQTDVEKTDTSEAMMPAVDDEGNEFYFQIKITVPRGRRNIIDAKYTPYDGYAAAKAYAEDQADKQAEKEVQAERKAREEAEKQRKRDAKKTVRELNKKGLNNMIHEGE